MFKVDVHSCNRGIFGKITEFKSCNGMLKAPIYPGYWNISQNSNRGIMIPTRRSEETIVKYHSTPTTHSYIVSSFNTSKKIAASFVVSSLHFLEGIEEFFSQDSVMLHQPSLAKDQNPSISLMETYPVYTYSDGRIWYSDTQNMRGVISFPLVRGNNPGLSRHPRHLPGDKTLAETLDTTNERSPVPIG